jgi:RHS repeat-associated protein
MRVGSTLYYVLKDHLGSASVLTDASGAPVTDADVRYFPFGEARFSTAPMLTDKLFTGQRLIADLGIYRYGARFYSPKLGRFLSPDKIMSSYANPQGLNQYSYVLKNPLRFTDPTGHRACDDLDESGECITAPGGGGQGFGGSPPKKPRGGGGGGPSMPNPAPGSCETGNFSPRCPGWHFYSTTNVVCPAYLNCSAEEMKYWFLRFAYPGQDPSEPVVDEQAYSVSFCINDRCFPMGPFGKIVVNISNGGFKTTNTTDPSHILYNGQVVRRLYQEEDGAWHVSSYGYGNNTATTGTVYTTHGPQNVEWSTAPANQLLGPYIFNNADQQMRMTILLNH